MTDPRVAVLASGEGTNVQALLDDPVVGPWVALVLSDRGEARALERARAAGVQTLTLHVPGGGRDAFDQPLLELLRDRGIDLVALAGFMRIVGPRFVAGYAGRIINVHPSLLPAFPGTSAVADALAWGVKMTGVTVHLVDEEVDHGPVVFQEAVRVEPDDHWDALEARIHEVEHRLLPAAVRAIGEGRVKVDGRRVRVLDEAPA
ncbi:MAG TPA: phosphoribosylglycinamide formyltransferase [Actinomycetota bacterium]|nr:phosphoribosylglycinamide formyltransferase [Actinomycetota bacterium]